MVSGCFDVVHAGHVQFLQDAKALGTDLVVCLAKDETIRHYKSHEPALPYEHRAAVLSAFRFVDMVIPATGTVSAVLDFSPELESIRPSILAVTTDDVNVPLKNIVCGRVGVEVVVIQKKAHWMANTFISSSSIREKLTNAK